MEARYGLVIDSWSHLLTDEANLPRGPVCEFTNRALIRRMAFLTKPNVVTVLSQRQRLNEGCFKET